MIHTSALRLAGFLTVTACLLLLSTSTNAQIRTWALTTSGAWDVDANWTGNDFPNSAAESAVLGGTTSYSVGFDLTTTTISDLTISNANAGLVIAPDLANTSLVVTNGFNNLGTISLNSNSTLDAALTVSSGTLTNSNVINFGGTSSSGATERRLSADVINNGTVNVNQDAHLNRASGIFTNNNTVNIAASRTLDFESSIGTFNQNGGTVNNLGSFIFQSDTLNFNGGNFTGNAISLTNSNLNIGGGSTGTGTFNIFGSSNYSGDLAANQVLNVLAGSSNTTLVATGDFANNGTININSDSTIDTQLVRTGTITNNSIINFGGTSVSAATERRLSADVVNNGTVNVNQDAHLNRANGVFTNNGTVNIAAGRTLDFESSIGIFNQNGGTVDNLGSFIFQSDTLNFNGGNFTGNDIS